MRKCGHVGPHSIKIKSLQSDPKEHPVDLGINQENHLQQHRKAALLG